MLELGDVEELGLRLGLMLALRLDDGLMLGLVDPAQVDPVTDGDAVEVAPLTVRFTLPA
jgi:hypothetical protein